MKVGSHLPAITLFDTNKQPIAINEQGGKNLVILFFPFAFTSVCTAELCNVRDNISTYNNVNATVYGISVDSLFTLERYKAEQHLNFTLLSDFNKEASKAFDVLYETFPAFGMQGVSKRAAFVVDKQGIIQYAEICATPGDQPDFEKLNSVLAQLNN